MTGCCGRMEVIMGDDVTLHAINGRALFFMRAIKGHTTMIIARLFRNGKLVLRGNWEPDWAGQ